MILQTARKINKEINHHALKVLLSGLVGVAGYNWHLWQRDKKLADRLKTEQRPVPTLSRTPKISVLVAAWNEQKHIENHIRSFLALQYKNIELILCVGGSDEGFELAKQFENEKIKIIKQLPGDGKQGALRKSLPLATGEIIYLTDIDCRPNDQVVVSLVKPLVVNRVDAATGSIQPLEHQLCNPFVSVIWSIERYNSLRTGLKSTGIRGANAVVFREALEASGSFAQKAPSGTDYTLAHELTKMGYTIAYVQDSEMPTEYPDTIAIYASKQSRWLRNVAMLGSKYKAWGEVRNVAVTLALPFLLICLLIIGRKYPKVALLTPLLIFQAGINRFRYANMSGLKVTVLAVFSSVIGDLYASILATFQILKKNTNWS